MNRIMLWGSVCLLLVIPVAGWGAEQTMTKEQMKKLVMEVIQENPGLVYDAYKKQEAKVKEEQARQGLDNAFKERVNDEVSKDNPSKGSDKAPVIIISYMDFQCPFCSRANTTLDRVFKMYPGKIRMVFKNKVIASHAQALPAARAALAAYKQGKFWEYHDRLFQNASTLNDAQYTSIASSMGLDLTRFEKDRASDAISWQIQKEEADFARAGLSGVPCFIINGVVVRGAKSADYFKQIIDRLLKEKK